MSISPPPPPPIPDKCCDPYACDSLRLEAVCVSVGFDDLLDHCLSFNHPHLDTMIVVTSHEDKKTKAVCQKHGAIWVPTDLLKKNGRPFNKGAAINAGFNRFQYNGWRIHNDADILYPDNLRRLLFNHASLDRDCIHGCDRINIVGKKEIDEVRCHRQHNHGYLIYPGKRQHVEARYVDGLSGYVPIGFFQLWHASRQEMYPWSLGSAAHDDVCFGTLWPQDKRRHLPHVICHHVTTEGFQKLGNNWNGRKQKRLS